MRAIIHIGTEKTGSTTIQAFIRSNRNRILSRGIDFLHFPGHHTSRPFVTWSLDPDHSDEEIVALGLSDEVDREKWRDDFRESVRKRLKALPSGVETVIFSSEHFQSRLLYASEVARLKSLLDEFFEEFEIILYLRRQDDVARSLYSTSLRTGKVPRRQLLAGKMKGPYFDYFGLMSRWVDVFGRENMNVRKYGRKFFRDGDLIADFCDVCGISDEPKLPRPDEKNQALSAVAQAALLELNLHFPGRIDGKVNEFNRVLRRTCTKYLAANFPGPTLMPAREEALEFYDTYRAGNEEMYEKFFDGVPIFDDNFSNYPEKTVDLSEVEGHREALLEAIGHFRKTYVKRPGVMLWKRLVYRVKFYLRRIQGEEE